MLRPSPPRPQLIPQQYPRPRRHKRRKTAQNARNASKLARPKLLTLP